jgi:subtilisin-like proprotein convertase family protein
MIRRNNMSEDISTIEKESSPNISIPDFYWNGVQDNLNVDVEGSLADIEVDVDIAHPYIGDLIVSLTAPSGKSLHLHYRQGGSKENLIHTYDLRNTPLLKNFVGENIKGEWTLSISDRGWRDVGTMRSWGIRLKRKEILGKAKWTLLAYIIGDDKPESGFSLDPYGLTDIKEMKEVGSTEQLRILVHRDRWEEPGAWRFDIGGPEGDVEDDIVESLPEKNAGDPNTLLEFVEWGVKRAPAEHYLLVLWNHGSGWYVPEVMRRASMAGLSRFSSRAEERNVGKMRLRKAIFATTLDKIFSIKDPAIRGICYDDTSTDCLDNQELEKVLSQCAQIMEKPKIDLVGMDACLMNMIEVAYQIRHNSSILVGSEESEPENGWPYDLVLTKLRDEPEISSAEFSKHIVRAYAESYSGVDITQSAIDLSKLDDP